MKYAQLQQAELPNLMHYIEEGGLTVISRDAEVTGQALLATVMDYLQSHSSLAVQGKLLTAQDVGVVALAERQLQIKLRSPTPYFLRQLSYSTFRPVPMHVLDTLVAKGIPTDQWTKPEHIVSSGPYVLHSHRFNWDIELRRNPLYYGADKVRLDSVVFVQIDNPYTVVNLYRNGELDWLGEVHKVPIAMVEQLRKYDDFWQEPSLGLEMYAFNMDRAPFDNLQVRRAFSLAVHREQLVRYITRGGEQPTARLVPSAIQGWEELNDVGYDPNLAREALAMAGYGPERPLPPIELLLHMDEKAKRIAEALQAMWQQHLGVKVTIRTEEWSVFLDTLHQKDFQLARYGWHADYPDANSFLSDLYASNSENNVTGLRSKAIDEALQAAYFIRDEQTRIVQLRAIEAMILAHQPIIPLYAQSHLSLVQPYLRGMEQNGLTYHPVGMLRFEPLRPGVTP